MRTKHWHVNGFQQYEDGRTQICLITYKNPTYRDFKRMLKKAYKYGQLSRFEYYNHKRDKGTIDLYIAYKKYCDAEKFVKNVFNWTPKSADTTDA